MAAISVRTGLSRGGRHHRYLAAALAVIENPQAPRGDPVGLYGVVHEIPRLRQFSTGSDLQLSRLSDGEGRFYLFAAAS
jgi:hypothetical protein